MNDTKERVRAIEAVLRDTHMVDRVFEPIGPDLEWAQSLAIATLEKLRRLTEGDWNGVPGVDATKLNTAFAVVAGFLSGIADYQSADPGSFVPAFPAEEVDVLDRLKSVVEWSGELQPAVEEAPYLGIAFTEETGLIEREGKSVKLTGPKQTNLFRELLKAQDRGLSREQFEDAYPGKNGTRSTALTDLRQRLISLRLTVTTRLGKTVLEPR